MCLGGGGYLNVRSGSDRSLHNVTSLPASLSTPPAWGKQCPLPWVGSWGVKKILGGTSVGTEAADCW